MSFRRIIIYIFGDKLTKSDQVNDKSHYEIKHLKLKIALAIVAPIFIVLSFLIKNHNDVLDLIFQTKLKINSTINNTFVDYEVILSNKKINYIFSSSQFVQSIKVQPGTYNISAKYYEKEIWKSRVSIESHSTTIVVLPDLFSGRILVNVINNTPYPFQGQPLSINIESSGNGCLWIYDLKNNNYYQRILPIDNTCHRVLAGKSITDINLVAGENKDSDSIAFLVTASDSNTIADSIIDKQFSKNPTKSSLNNNVLNWGLKVLRYKIKDLD